MKIFKLFFTTLLISGLLISCQQQNSQSNCSETFYITDFDYLGEWHNDFLQNIKDNFDPDTYSQSLNLAQKVDVINAFHKAYIPNLGLDNTQAYQLSNAVDSFKNLVNLTTAYSLLYNSLGASLPQTAAAALLQFKNQGYIDNFEYNSMTHLLNLVQQNYNGVLDVEQLRSEIIILRNGWDSQGYTECSSTGWFSATVLSISFESVEWWMANPDALDNERIAPWLAADIGGAVAGAIFGTIWTIGLGDGSPGWGDIGRIGLGALGAGFSASTGLAGKITKFLFG